VPSEPRPRWRRSDPAMCEVLHTTYLDTTSRNADLVLFHLPVKGLCQQERGAEAAVASLPCAQPAKRLFGGSEWIRTYSSALDRRRFRGSVRVAVDHRPTGHPSSCGWAARTASEIIDPDRRALAGTQPPSDLELAPWTFGGGNHDKVFHRLIRLFTSGACCGRRLTVRQ
jgi:hypothetical protein